MKYLIFLFLVFFSFFVLAKEPLIETTNRANMTFNIGSYSYEGIGVVPRASQTTIKFLIPDNTIRLTITTCNREEFYQSPQAPFYYSYIPIMYLENLDSCILIATAITSKGTVHKSFIDFVTGEELEGQSKCNGRVLNRKGVELCQSRTGLIQVIQFSEPVAQVTQPGCEPLSPAFGAYAFQYKMGSGFCSYKFINKKKQKFRLTTFGYSSIKDILTEDKE